MNSFERVMSRLEGRSVDKIPNLSIIMTFAAKFIGVPYYDYVSNYKYLVEGNIRCCDEFGIDMVSAISDPCREGYDMGADIRMPKDDVPSFKGVFLKDFSNLNKIKVIKPTNGKRMLDRIKAIDLFKKRVGNIYPILGWVEGAFASASNFRGVNNFMLDLIDKPDKVHELLEICTEQAILFAREQVKAGADFIGIGDATASLIGPHHYQEFVLPYEKRICEEIRNQGAKTKLHICGDISSFIPYISDVGADIVDIDWKVDFSDAVQILSEDSSACGNFNPVDILLQGTKKDIEVAVKKCIIAAREDTFIAPGCEVPKNTPLENMYSVSKFL